MIIIYVSSFEILPSLAVLWSFLTGLLNNKKLFVTEFFQVNRASSLLQGENVVLLCMLARVRTWIDVDQVVN